MQTMALWPEEQLAFAGLLRLMARLDRQLSREERDALAGIAEQMPGREGGGLGASYRDATGPPSDSNAIAFWDVLDRAARELPDDEAVHRAALGVTRKEAQETIYAALYELAASDAVAHPEMVLLEWLAETWNLKPTFGESSKW